MTTDYRTRVLARWLACAGMLCLVSTESAHASQAFAPVPGLKETMPPVAHDGLFGEAQIRYCLAQLIRIEAIRPLLDPTQNAQVAYFNYTVADYNERCGRYRYTGDALARAKREVEALRAPIEQAARAAVREHFAPPPAVERETAAAAPELAPTASLEPAPRAQPELTPAAQPELTSRAQPAPTSQAQPAPTSQAQPTPTSQAQLAPTSQAQPAPASPAPPGPTPAARAESTSPVQPHSTSPAQPEPAMSAQPAGPPTPKPTQGTGEMGERAATGKPSRAAEDKPAAPAPTKAEPPPLPTPRAPASVAAAAPEPAVATLTPLERYRRALRRDPSLIVPEQAWPPAAQGMGWEGSTYVDVRFAAQGYVRSINLAQTSGHEVLDEEAVRIVRTLSFPEVPADLHGMEFTIRVPVVFRTRPQPPR